MRPVRTAARVFLSAIFVIQGARSAMKPDPFVPRASKVTQRVGPMLENVHPRLPKDDRTLVQLNAVLQMAAGLVLASGRFSRPAAAVLASTLVPVTLAGHPFWEVKDQTERRKQEVHFMKNMGLLGGLLLAAADTQGRPSLGWRASHYAGHGRHAVAHSQQSVRRAARTAKREARIAVRAAAAGRKLPG